MATLKGGYKLKDGTKVPGVTTILGRFKESGGLMHWAWKMGMEGKNYRDFSEAAATAGTMAHTAVEKFIAGESYDFPEDDIGRRAQNSFGAFREWADQTQLKVTHTEVPLVSEVHGFGGCLDAMLVRGKLSLGDWKTSNGIYGDYLAQLGAYGILWEENFPDEPITGGYHLLRFDKEFGDFHHHWWSELDSAKRFFLLLKEAYSIDQELKKRVK